MFFLYSAADPTIKHKQFEIFYYCHFFSIPFFLLLLSHGAQGYNPNFWKWFIIPGVLFGLDRGLRIYRSRRPATLLQAVFMASNNPNHPNLRRGGASISSSVSVSSDSVFSLEFDKTGVFKGVTFREGQYLFVKCPVCFIQGH